MQVWRVSHSPKTGAHTHVVAEGLGHGLVIPVVSAVFGVLRVHASVSQDGFWWPIHAEANIASFELEHGVESERYEYNERVCAEVRRRKQAILAEHAGYSDWFVPVVIGGDVAALLVSGPFARARPTSAEILERWHWLTGRQGHPADPEFASYLSTALATLVLEGARTAKFGQLLEHLARLMAGDGPAEKHANLAELLYLDLREARAVDVTWDAVRSMIDDRFPRSWSSSTRVSDLNNFGLSRPPDQVLIGLTASPAAEADPVDHAVRLDAFQRRAVELARAAGESIAGQAGDHGVVFVCSSSGSVAKRTQRLLSLSDRVSGVARRDFGLSVHFGMSLVSGSGGLSRCFQAALGAAESALVQGSRIVSAGPGGAASSGSLRELRKQLADVVEDHPELLGPRVDRYLEAVAALVGYRIDAARAHLEVGFERMIETLVESGALDQKSSNALRDALDRTAAGARTISELFAVYREAALDVRRAVQSPVPARHDRSLRAAVDYIHQHYGEALDLNSVARTAGYAPSRFSKLFAEREGIPFVEYVALLRIERAKQLLTGTELEARRVAERCGFNSLQYFCRVFRRAVGVTPLEYRRKAGKLRRIGRPKNTTRKTSKYKRRTDRPR